VLRTAPNPLLHPHFPESQIPFVFHCGCREYQLLSYLQPLSKQKHSPEGLKLKRLGILIAVVFLYVTAGMAQATFSSIESTSGIKACSTCAGVGGNGPSAAYWMKQGQSAPSMDGKSTQFYLGGSTPYSDAMWTKTLTSSTKYKNFTFDTYYYVKDPSGVQGLEFNITNYASNKGYTFGFTCDVKSSHTWKISVPNSSTSSMSQMHWESTGISCPTPKAYSWNHVTFDAQRTSDNKVKFISLTINGSKHYINKTVYARSCPSGWGGVTTHVQLNGDYKQTDYSVWTDKWLVKLS
jgi:hypothetical protein